MCTVLNQGDFRESRFRTGRFARYPCVGAFAATPIRSNVRTGTAQMQRLLQLGPYYFLLDSIARFCQARDINPLVKTGVSLLLLLALLAVAWLGAEWLTLRVGEFPGSFDYLSVKFKYMMRLLCMETLLLAGALLATVMAQQSAKIPDYR